MQDGAITLQTMINELPNFAGLLIALFIMVRQNTKLTEALITLTRDCDCTGKGDKVLETVLNATHIDGIPEAPAPDNQRGN